MEEWAIDVGASWDSMGLVRSNQKAEDCNTRDRSCIFRLLVAQDEVG